MSQKPPDLTSRVLYRDGLILIIDKPAGIPVHAGPGGGPTVEDGLEALRFGLPKQPALAHRLDRDTGGCLVLGRHPKALRKLGILFSSNRVEKTYWAVVRGRPTNAAGRIDLALEKVSTAKHGWRMVVSKTGKPAVTDYRILGEGSGEFSGLTWVEFRPKTGRTHQIRVHCQASGFPILGDPQYGFPEDRSPGAPSLHLLSRAIALPLSKSKPPIRVEAPVPTHMEAAFVGCGYDAERIAPYIS